MGQPGLPHLLVRWGFFLSLCFPSSKSLHAIYTAWIARSTRFLAAHSGKTLLLGNIRGALWRLAWNSLIQKRDNYERDSLGNGGERKAGTQVADYLVVAWPGELLLEVPHSALKEISPFYKCSPRGSGISCCS